MNRNIALWYVHVAVMDVSVLVATENKLFFIYYLLLFIYSFIQQPDAVQFNTTAAAYLSKITQQL